MNMPKGREARPVSPGGKRARNLKPRFLVFSAFFANGPMRGTPAAFGGASQARASRYRLGRLFYYLPPLLSFGGVAIFQIHAFRTSHIFTNWVSTT